MLYRKTIKMKSLVLFAICFITLQVSAQGNLQFNQVIKVSSSTMTVPAGKVWKIESYQQSNVSGTSNSTSGCDINRIRPYIIDGQVYHNIKNIATANAGYIYAAENRMPIWLAEGQTAATSCPSDFLSVIEFNIIP
jgi:hypothetical protein